MPRLKSNTPKTPKGFNLFTKKAILAIERVHQWEIRSFNYRHTSITKWCVMVMGQTHVELISLIKPWLAFPLFKGWAATMNALPHWFTRSIKYVCIVMFTSITLFSRSAAIFFKLYRLMQKNSSLTTNSKSIQLNHQVQPIEYFGWNVMDENKSNWSRRISSTRCLWLFGRRLSNPRNNLICGMGSE